MERKRSDFFDYHVICETFTNPLNGWMKKGRMLLDGDLGIDQFREDAPRVHRYPRNRHIYGSLSDGLLIMQRCDGTYRLTLDFLWSGQSTFQMLQRVCSQVYQALKQTF